MSTLYSVFRPSVNFVTKNLEFVMPGPSQMTIEGEVYIFVAEITVAANGTSLSLGYTPTWASSNPPAVPTGKIFEFLGGTIYPNSAAAGKLKIGYSDNAVSNDVAGSFTNPVYCLSATNNYAGAFSAATETIVSFPHFRVPAGKFPFVFNITTPALSIIYGRYITA